MAETAATAAAGVARTRGGLLSALARQRELSLVAIYQAPASEVAQICGNADALGCYGDVGGQPSLFFPGDLGTGPDLEVATHAVHTDGPPVGDPLSLRGRASARDPGGVRRLGNGEQRRHQPATSLPHRATGAGLHRRTVADNDG